MASRYEVEVTISSARDLKNVNWRHGDLKAYAVVWIDTAAKCSTKADLDGDTSPAWDEKLVLPLPHGDCLDDAILSVDVVHAAAADGVKPLIGSARLHLCEVIDEVGLGSKCSRSLKIKRPSGRPQGRIELKVKVAVKSPPPHHHHPDPYAQSYGQPPASREIPSYAGGGGDYGYGSRGTSPYPAGGGSYGQSYGAPPTGYPYGGGAPAAATGGYGYGAPPPQEEGYGYGAPLQKQTGYGYGGSPTQQQTEVKKKSKFGMGTGLAVGAAAGVLGGLALAGGAEYLEHKIADDAADKVEEDLGYDDDF